VALVSIAAAAAVSLTQGVQAGGLAVQAHVLASDLHTTGTEFSINLGQVRVQHM
jgi:hypothetical protein